MAEFDVLACPEGHNPNDPQFRNLRLSRLQVFSFLVIVVAFLFAAVWVPLRARAVDNEINYSANTVWDTGSVDDSVSSTLTIPFTFTYWGNNFTQAVMSSNGLFTLGATGNASYSNGTLPSINNTIYAFWDDLMVQSVNSASQTTVLYQTVGTAPNRKFIGQWTGIYFYGTTVQMGTFQVILYETSNVVQIQYRNIVGTGRSQGNSATIGIQGPSNTQYLQFLANSASSLLVDGFALKYTPSGSTYTVTSGATYDPVYLIPSTGVASPVLSAPTDGATGVATTPSLSWSAATNATGYKVYLATDSQFSTLVASTPASVSSAITSWSPASALTNGTTYYWRVESLRNALSSLSGTRSFTTSAVTKSAQAALTVVPGATSVNVGSTTTLTTSGGSGTGAVTYAIAAGSAYCSVSADVLTAISAGTCSVTATKAADATYYSVTSSAVSITTNAVVTRTVTYNGNNNTGGSVPPNGTATSGSSFTVASNSGSLVRTGYTFGGWNTTANGSGSLYAAGTGTLTLNADTTLYAVWTPNTLTVTYDSQGGSAISSGTTTTGASLAVSPGSPTWSGYTFNGWYVAATGGSALTFPYAHGQTSNFTIYAHWLIDQVGFAFSNTPASVAYASSTTLSTTGGNGTGGVSFASTTPSVCTINTTSGAISMLVGTGTCSIAATKASDGTYAAATTNVDIAATKASQSSLNISGSSSAAYGATVSLATSGGSTSGAITWSAGASTACSVNAFGVVSVTAGAGTCSITATMAGSSNYLSVTSASFQISVSPANQSTLTITSTSAVYGVALSLTSSGGSGTGSVTYAVSSGSCFVLGSLLTLGDAGSLCSVVATKAADSNYNAISSAPTSVVTARANQSSFSLSTTSVTYGQTLLLNSAGGTGGGVVTYSVSSGTCTISGDILTPGDAGSTCLVTATKALDTNYNAVASSPTAISIARANQAALSVTSISATYGQTMTLTSSGGSGTGAVTYSVVSGTCTISGTTLTPGDAGSSCVVKATKALSTNYNAIDSADTTVSIARATQVALTLSSTTVTYGQTLSLTTTGGSGTGSVSYAVSSGSCFVIGSLLTVGDAGSSCAVVATKAQDMNYVVVSSAPTSITINKATQSTVTVSSISATYGQTMTLTSSGGSGTGAVTYSVVSGTCTISGTALTPGNAGSSCVVKATKATDTNYNERSSTNTTVTVNKANQSGVNITSVNSFTTGGALVLAATGGQSSGSLSWSLTSGTCILTGNVLSAVRGGISCVVEVTRAGDSNYLADSVTDTITVNKISQLLTFRSTAPVSPVVGTTYTVAVDSDASLTPTIVIAGSSSSVCSLSAGVVTFNNTGSCVISASQAGTDVYASAAASQSITVVAVPVTTVAAPATSGSGSTAPAVSTTLPQSAVAKAVPSTSTTSTTTTTTTTIPADPGSPVLGADGQPVELKAGEATAVVSGKSVKVNVQTADGQIVMKVGTEVQLKLGSTNPSSDSARVNSDGTLVAFGNQYVDVNMQGLIPGTLYTIYMFSDPIELGRGTANAKGAIVEKVLVPKGVKTGGHTLQVNGVGPKGELVSLSVGMKILKKEGNMWPAVISIVLAMLLALLSGRPIFRRRRIS